MSSTSPRISKSHQEGNSPSLLSLQAGSNVRPSARRVSPHPHAHAQANLKGMSPPLPGASPSHTDVQSLTHSLAEPRGVGTGCGHAPLQRVGPTIWPGCPRAPLPGSSQSEVSLHRPGCPLCCRWGPAGAAPTGPSPAAMAATCAEGRRWSGLTPDLCSPPQAEAPHPHHPTHPAPCAPLRVELSCPHLGS